MKTRKEALMIEKNKWGFLLLSVRFLTFKKYDLRILSERITCTAIITRDKRHKEFSSGKP